MGFDGQGQKLNVAVMMLQPDCNMDCSFCITEEKGNFTAMTLDQAQSFLKYFKSLGVKSVVIGGGEPFFWHQDLLSVCRKAKALDMTVQVGTNGVALPEGFERFDGIDRYVIPLESLEPGAHNQMRFYKKRHHQIILDRLNKLKAAGKSVTLSTVITQNNKDDILELAEFIRSYHQGSEHVHAWHIYQFVPVGRGGQKNAGKLSIPDEEYHQIYSQLKDLKLPFNLFKRANMYQSKTVDFFWCGGDSFYSGRHGKIIFEP